MINEEKLACFILEEIFRIKPTKGMVSDILNNCNQDFHDAYGRAVSYKAVRDYLNRFEYIEQEIDNETYYDED